MSGYRGWQTSAHMAKYIDNSMLWSVSSTSENSQPQRSAQEAATCTDDNLTSLNCDKTEDMVVCFVWKCPLVPAIKLGGSKVECVRWNSQAWYSLTTSSGKDISTVCGKGSSWLYFLRMPRWASVAPKDTVAIYVALICSILESACQVWHTGLTAQQSDHLELAQRSAQRVAYPEDSYRAALKITDTQHSPW